MRRAMMGVIWLLCMAVCGRAFGQSIRAEVEQAARDADSAIDQAARDAREKTRQNAEAERNAGRSDPVKLATRQAITNQRITDAESQAKEKIRRIAQREPVLGPVTSLLQQMQVVREEAIRTLASLGSSLKSIRIRIVSVTFQGTAERITLGNITIEVWTAFPPASLGTTQTLEFSRGRVPPGAILSSTTFEKTTNRTVVARDRVRLVRPIPVPPAGATHFRFQVDAEGIDSSPDVDIDTWRTEFLPLR